jgi:hypothetical protein
MSKPRLKADKKDALARNDIGVRMTISREVTPKVHAALASLDRYALSRRVQHLLTLGLEHEEQEDLLAAVAEQAKLSSEFLRRLLNSNELLLAQTNTGANTGTPTDQLGNDTGSPSNAQVNNKDEQKRHMMALKLASH